MAEDRSVAKQNNSNDSAGKWLTHYQSLIENSLHCMHEVDTGGMLTSINRAGLELLSVSDSGEVVSKP